MIGIILPFLLYGLPEALMLVLSSLGLLGIRTKPGRLLVAGLGFGILTLIPRIVLFVSYLHTPFILLCLIVTLIIFFKLSISTAITGCFLSFFLLRLGESVLLPPILNLTKIAFNNTLVNPWLHILFGWISSIFLIIAIIICYIGKIPLVRAPESIDNCVRQ